MTPHGTQLLHRGKQANASNLDDFQEIIVLQALLVDLCYMDILYRYKYSCLSLFVAEKVEMLSFHLMCNNNLLIPESLLTIHCAKIFEMQTIRIIVLEYTCVGYVEEFVYTNYQNTSNILIIWFWLMQRCHEVGGSDIDVFAVLVYIH